MPNESENVKVADKKGKNKPKWQKVTADEIKEALIKAQGLVSYAATILSKEKGIKITHQAISKRIRSSESLQACSDDCTAKLLDKAEFRLSELIDKGDLGAICFFLKCKGKKRGYVERQEVTGADGGALGPISLNVEFTDKVDAGDEKKPSDS